jgi:5-methyltetrahydrofolate--homocysteine methyltransferase
VIGLFFPANSVGDDVENLWPKNRAQRQPRHVHFSGRQQMVKPLGKPEPVPVPTGGPEIFEIARLCGAFAVTGGIGIDARVADYERKHDDYNAILLQGVGRRLAEAFAEHMHQRVRREFWGYAKDESLGVPELIDENIAASVQRRVTPRGPEPYRERTLVLVPHVSAETGITLTESFAMLPTAAVSGFIAHHPASAIFSVRGKKSTARPGPGDTPPSHRRQSVQENANAWLARPISIVGTSRMPNSAA